ncbi:MAG: tetratricopeptide repeat protein [Actinomycetota bacterium]|nr:tetratricopeptide repeat protein [Actinomycetota bacterium]
MSISTSKVLRIVNIVLIVGIVLGLGGVAYRVLTTDPSTPTTELERALLTAEEAVKANPEDPTARIKLAAAYLERGNLTGAFEQADIAVRLDPEDPTGYYMKGLAEADLGRTSDAIKSLSKAVETEGQLAGFYQDAWLALSRAHEKDGNDEKALFSMTKAVNNGPENVVLLNERGQLYERMEDWQNAMDDYASALEYVPNYEPALASFNRLKKDHPDVFKKLQELYGIEDTSTPAPGDK